LTDHQTTLLVVDDEAFNRDLIGDYLEDMHYALDYAVDGLEAWEKLEAGPNLYDAVLLARIKGDARLAGIPVILQTAATAPEQIKEGMRLGAYYYLTKPFPRQALVAAVSTALSDSKAQRAMREALERTQRVLHLLTEARFRFRNLDEARTLAAELANRAASPGTVVIGLAEILINAVEHGNLGLNYQDKSRLLSSGGWDEEISRRLQDPAYAGHEAEIRCQFDQGMASLTIRDQGEGFAWQSFLEVRPERAFDLHGRGIALACQISFSSIEYQGNSNTVRVTFPLA
jgi:CheY-like chemotaxis protein